MYHFGQHPGFAAVFGNYTNSYRNFEDNELKKLVESLQSQLDELKDRFELLQIDSGDEQIINQAVGESVREAADEAGQYESFEEQFVTLRSDQIAAFQNLLATLLNSEARERIINIQIETTAEDDTNDMTEN